MSPLLESHLEEFVLGLLREQGWIYRSVDDLSGERPDLSDPVLHGRLRVAVDRLNPHLPDDAREYAVRRVLSLSGQGLVERNEIFHHLLVDGVPVEYRRDDRVAGDRARLVDWSDPLANDLVVTSQYTVTGERLRKRPDVVLLVNGLPLVVIELKNAGSEDATSYDAFCQLQNYQAATPRLFDYNAVLVASDGLDARTGSLTADWSRFLAWKAIDGVRQESDVVPQIETLVRGMLRPDVLLDLVSGFTVFEKVRREDSETGQTRVETIKKIAAYHQYQAVNKAVERTRAAASDGGDRKAGIVWHTQGSGKSLSMAFYVGKLVLGLDNPTVVVITDRNDLDDQLFDTFAACKHILRQDPVQAENRAHLKSLLRTGGGGIVFTTIQKFSPEDGVDVFDLLSDRRNIVVIADEAHRSQYGFK